VRRERVNLKRGRRLWYALLAVPFAATLWPAGYASLEPQLFGFPFFYWYQLLWIVLGAVIVAAVYLLTREAPPRP
jgi:hypothetical protein